MSIESAYNLSKPHMIKELAQYSKRGGGIHESKEAYESKKCKKKVECKNAENNNNKIQIRIFKKLKRKKCGSPDGCNNE